MEVKVCPACGKENDSEAKECIYCLEPIYNIKKVANHKKSEEEQVQYTDDLNYDDIKPLYKSLYNIGNVLFAFSIIVAISFIIIAILSNIENAIITNIIVGIIYFFVGLITRYCFKWMAFMLKTNNDIINKLK